MQKNKKIKNQWETFSMKSVIVMKNTISGIQYRIDTTKDKFMSVKISVRSSSTSQPERIKRNYKRHNEIPLYSYYND